jgi:hypothetical protein
VSIIPKSEYNDYEWFEDLDRLDDMYLNKYEQGVDLNKQYIFDLWGQMENSFKYDEWQLRVDR